MADDRNENQGSATGAQTEPSIDSSTGEPIEESEKNLSRHATKDSSPPVAEQGRTTEKVDDTSPRAGSETRAQQDERARERDL
jgi:hypothetical protein